MQRTRWAAVFLTGFVPLPSFAQSASPPPQSVESRLVTQGYRSAFTGFQTFEEARQPDWPASNERVRTTGGHAGALKESEDEQDESASPAPDAGHHK